MHMMFMFACRACRLDFLVVRMDLTSLSSTGSALKAALTYMGNNTRVHFQPAGTLQKMYIHLVQHPTHQQSPS